MDATLIIVKTIGVYFIVSGLFVIFNRRTLTMILRDMFDHRAITYIVGIVMLAGGTALILSNKVTDGLSNFVEIMAWLILIKGLFYIFVPNVMKDMLKGISRLTFTLSGITIAAIGAYLIFFI